MYFILYTNTSGRKTWRVEDSYDDMEKACAEIAGRIGKDPYAADIDQYIHVFMGSDMLVTDTGESDTQE